ncbi:hypothetical protein O1611_g5613 [Lasiodiplodia mahajangana]|uniref:Uncharacterized protein n=1 Tax=Lasiodiplodia mahajangana TaxID=1108764 RepID=A0ACC2JKV6_9PEZI|nr:hypothetical protein O1611_g5613 [Lasiodiplodia mahajangana]
MSNSSDVSPLPSPDFRSEDIVLSARPSPGLTTDNPQPPRSPHSYLRSSSTRSSPRSINADEASTSGPTKLTPPRSQPIAIELPAPKKVSSAPVYTPPAPLSARGDLPGGYFPLHEEQARVYRPHPFQLDATKARMKSIQRASKNSPSSGIQSTSRAVGIGDVGPATTNVPPAKADRAMEIPQFNVGSLRRPESASSSTTPVASYMPLGDRSSPLPMGKYYPSNYERRKDEKKGKHRPKTSDSTTSSSSKSEVPVPHITQPSTTGHSRNESEAKRRLQQYQRDMIAQATIALNRGSATEAALGPIRSLGFTNMIKPSKPRLAPLGSPGPVTPMELEGSAGGYLEVHRTAEVQLELTPPNRGEEERIRIRQDGDTSPAVELGPSTSTL